MPLVIEQVVANEDGEQLLDDLPHLFARFARRPRSQEQFGENGRADMLAHHQWIPQVEGGGLNRPAQEKQGIVKEVAVVG